MRCDDPEGCFYTWPDGEHASRTCMEDAGHDDRHICSCGATHSGDRGPVDE